MMDLINVIVAVIAGVIGAFIGAFIAHWLGRSVRTYQMLVELRSNRAYASLRSVAWEVDCDAIKKHHCREPDERERWEREILAPALISLELLAGLYNQTIWVCSRKLFRLSIGEFRRIWTSSVVKDYVKNRSDECFKQIEKMLEKRL